MVGGGGWVRIVGPDDVAGATVGAVDVVGAALALADVSVAGADADAGAGAGVVMVDCVNRGRGQVKGKE